MSVPSPLVRVADSSPKGQSARSRSVPRSQTSAAQPTVSQRLADLQLKSAASPATQYLNTLQHAADARPASRGVPQHAQPVAQAQGLGRVKAVAGSGADAGQVNHTPFVPKPIHTPLTAPASGPAPVQMVRYSVKRDLTLEKGIKTFEGSKAKKGKKGKPDKAAQSAKTRAMGEFLAVLRSEYPLPKDAEGLEFEGQEAARGGGYLQQKKLVEIEFDAVDDDAEKVDVYRPAIQADMSDAKRSGGTQAGPVSKLTGKEYIGAHLVKREWGGEDNMWNVVAWPKDTAEDVWAEAFESPVDKAGLWGMDPGTVSISVTKEDEVIAKGRLDSMIEGAVRKMKADDETSMAAISRSLDEHVMDPINTERRKLNRAVESVPVEATGVNRSPDIKTGEIKQSTTTLDATSTGYTFAAQEAVKALRPKVHAEVAKTKEMDARADAKRHPRAPKPERLRDADSRETGKRSDERDKAWKQELGAYAEGFDTSNDVV